MNEQIGFKLFASDLCAALPSGWTVKPTETMSWYVELNRADGAKLLVSTGYDTSKWHIAGGSTIERAHSYLPYQERFPGIHVSKTKSADVIARDIERRIMPELERLLVIVNKRHAGHEAHTALTLENAVHLSKLLNRDEPRLSDNGYQAEISNYIAGFDEHRHAKVTVRGDRIAIEIDALTVGEAEAILRIARGEPSVPQMKEQGKC